MFCESRLKGTTAHVSRRVAFTFDTESGGDCPHNTLGASGWREILDILRDEGVRATFFVIGSWAREQPELARRTIAEGHVIGNHTDGHISLARNPRKARAQIRAGERSILAVTGCSSKPWFRLPYLDGDTDERVLRTVHSLGFEHIKENWRRVRLGRRDHSLPERPRSCRDGIGRKPRPARCAPPQLAEAHARGASGPDQAIQEPRRTIRRSGRVVSSGADRAADASPATECARLANHAAGKATACRGRGSRPRRCGVRSRSARSSA